MDPRSESIDTRPEGMMCPEMVVILAHRKELAVSAPGDWTLRARGWLLLGMGDESIPVIAERVIVAR